MKRILLFMTIATVAIVSAFAFTNKPVKPVKHAKNQSVVKQPQALSVWYWKYYLTNQYRCCKNCYTLADYRNPINYTKVLGAPPVGDVCQGTSSDGLCAIFAYSAGGTPERPNISSSSLIYTKLYNWYTFDMDGNGTLFYCSQQE